MNNMLLSLLAPMLALSALNAETAIEEVLATEEAAPINKLHILYLMQSKELSKSIDLYRQYRDLLGRHDFEILQQMALIILDQGTRSSAIEERTVVDRRDCRFDRYFRSGDHKPPSSDANGIDPILRKDAG